MNPASVDIATLLGDASLPALTLGTDLYVSEMPDTPDLCVATFDIPGQDPEVNYVYERPFVQIVVRGDKGQYVAGHVLAQAVRDVIHGRHNVTVGTSRYVGIWQEGDIGFSGYDHQHRPEFSMHFRIHRTGV